MDGILLVMGSLLVLGGLISIFLIWGESKHFSKNSLNLIDRLRAEGTKLFRQPRPKKNFPYSKIKWTKMGNAPMTTGKNMVPGGEPPGVEANLTSFKRRENNQ